MAIDEARFYCVSRQTLRAISLADGGSLWSAHLTGPEDLHWSIALTRDHVMAFPASYDSSEPDEVAKMPLIVRQRDTGALVQRFVFSTTIFDVTFNVDPRGVLVATSRGLWGLGQKEGSQSGLACPPGDFAHDSIDRIRRVWLFCRF